MAGGDGMGGDGMGGGRDLLVRDGGGRRMTLRADGRCGRAESSCGRAELLARFAALPGRAMMTF